MDPDNRSCLTCEVIWADPDLLEISVRVAFGGWRGVETAYVSREAVTSFAHQLGDVAEGSAGTARLDAGQADLSYARITLYEYGGARRLAAEVELGRAPDTLRPGPALGSTFHLHVPIERGQLAAFVAGLRRSVQDERGLARLPLPDEWP